MLLEQLKFVFISFVVQNGGEQQTRTLVLGQLFSHHSWEFPHCLLLLHRIMILLHSTQELQEKVVGVILTKVMAGNNHIDLVHMQKDVEFDLYFPHSSHS